MAKRWSVKSCFFVYVPLVLTLALGAPAMSLLLAPVVARAQVSDELLTVTYEGMSRLETPIEAQREIQAKAVSETARAQALELLGEKRYQKNKGPVETRIVRQAVKFIPFVNPGSLQKLPDGSWKMPVEMKISMPSLQKMVLDAGFMSESEGPASILPMIAFVDRTKATSVRWWMGEEKGEAHRFLAQLGRSVHQALGLELLRQGFHLIRPQGLTVSPLPEAFRVDRPSSQELKFISDYFQATMILKGDVRLREARTRSGVYLCSVRLQVVQTASGRTIGEVSRTIETEAGAYEAVVRAKVNAEMPEIAKDLAVQVLDAWQRGTLNANLLRLAVRGPLNPRQVTEFKSELLKSVREVKSMRERLFEPGQITFEVDFAGQPDQLAERLGSAQLEGFATRVAASGSGGAGVTIDVRAAR